MPYPKKNGSSCLSVRSWTWNVCKSTNCRCMLVHVYIYICEVIAKLNKKTRVLYDGDDDECIDIYLMLMSLHHHFDNECCFLCLQKLQKKRKKKMVAHYETVKAYSLRQWKQNQLGKNKKSPAVLFDYRTKLNWNTIFHHNKFNWFIILKHFNKIIRFVHIYLYIDR